jgi:hypothetical protein
MVSKLKNFHPLYLRFSLSTYFCHLTIVSYSWRSTVVLHTTHLQQPVRKSTFSFNNGCLASSLYTVLATRCDRSQFRRHFLSPQFRSSPEISAMCSYAGTIMVCTWVVPKMKSAAKADFEYKLHGTPDLSTVGRFVRNSLQQHLIHAWTTSHACMLAAIPGTPVT